MRTYKQFINEQNETKLSIQDVQNTIQEIFSKDDVLSTDSVFEPVNGVLKLIISISKLYSSDQVIIYTKLLFDIDNQKKYLTSNTFKYLYEINCQFEEVQFDNLNDLKDKINEVINKDKFGNDIKTLSDFIKKPEHTINQWFYNNKTENISITGVKYKPEMKNIPCKELSFGFTITVNEQDDIELDIKKLGVGQFKLTFKIFNKTVNVEKSNLNTLVQDIGETIRDSYEK
jgi:hypothetical protein